MLQMPAVVRKHISISSKVSGSLDPAWQYRDSVQITNPGGTGLTDFRKFNLAVTLISIARWVAVI